MGEAGWIGEVFKRFSALLIYSYTFQSRNFKAGLLCLAPLFGETVKSV